VRTFSKVRPGNKSASRFANPIRKKSAGGLATILATAVLFCLAAAVCLDKMLSVVDSGLSDHGSGFTG